MKFSNALFGLILFVSLTACSPTPVRFEPVVNVNWQQQQQLQKQIQSWTISGRISIQTEYQGGQADYSWQQHNPTDYNIRLQAPMGAGTTLINGSENGVSLKSSSGDEMFDTDVDKLMLRLNGWPLPVSGLQYWVRGLPTPNSAYEITQWKESGLPAVMMQDGWRIEFKKYKSIEDKYLPSKLFINRLKGGVDDEEAVDVRLIIRQWTLNTELSAGINKGSAP